MNNPTPARVPVPRLRRVAAVLACFVPHLVPAQAGLPSFIDPGPLTGTTGMPVDYRISATDGTLQYFAALPPGLRIDTASGHIAGSPAHPVHGQLQVFATNPHGTVGRMVTFAFISPPLWLGPLAENEPAVEGSPYVAGVPAYWNSRYAGEGLAFTASGLPPGLQITPGGRIVGTPGASGTFHVMVRAVGSPGDVSRLVTITVEPQPAAGPARIARVTTPPERVYQAGIPCPLTVVFTEPVRISGRARLAVSVGRMVRYATMAAPPLADTGAPATVLPLELTFDPADMDTDGILLASGLEVDGGTITDGNGNEIGLGFVPPDTRGVLVSPLAPPVPSIFAVEAGPDTVTLTGTGEGVVLVSLADSGVVGETTASNGQWTLSYSTAGLPAGTYAFTARSRLPHAAVYSEPSAAARTQVSVGTNGPMPHSARPPRNLSR